MAFENEARLVARMLAGEAGAVEEFIAQYRPFIFAILLRHLKLSPDEAEEIFQRFLVRIWEQDYRRLRDWRGKTRLAVYLARIARNLAHDYRRESRFFVQESPDWPVEDDTLQNIERQIMIETALAKLSPRERSLIHRRFLLEESYEEIAEALEMTPNSVGVALLRAKLRLKHILGQKK